MIRGDWRWAHKTSIIPPSDRRRYRPTRWPKSTKIEQNIKTQVGQSVHRLILTAVLLVKVTMVEGKVPLSPFRFHFPFFRLDITKSRYTDLYQVRIRPLLGNWTILTQDRIIVQIKESELRPRKFIRHTDPHFHFEKHRSYNSQERHNIYW